MLHDPAAMLPNPPELLTIETELLDAAVVLTLLGEIDLFTAPLLRSALLESLAEGQPLIVVDLSAVTFLGSCGVDVLFTALTRARAQACELRLAGGDRPVRVALDATGLRGQFEHYPDREQAVGQPVVFL